MPRLASHRAHRSHGTRGLWRLPMAGGLALAWLLHTGEARAQDSMLEVRGMTFSASREDGGEIVLSSERAEFEADTRQAVLFDVDARVSPAEDAVPSFSLVCDRAELNIDTNDFRANGQVRGKTASGEHYSADWVRFDPESDLLYSDSPVKVSDGSILLRGDGFRYDLTDERLKLLGNVSVVHQP